MAVTMAWQTIPGVTGKIYVPDQMIHDGKRPCPDCFACQQCSRERCAVCRDEKASNEPPVPPGCIAHITKKT
jgi:hypothetical protein